MAEDSGDSTYKGYMKKETGNKILDERLLIDFEYL